MTPEEFDTAYVPVSIRQRHIVPGDSFIGRDGQLWQVRDTRPGWMDAARMHTFRAADVDPDQTFDVLTPVPMAQAVATARAELGMQLIERRDDAAGTGAVA